MGKSLITKIIMVVVIIIILVIALVGILRSKNKQRYDEPSDYVLDYIAQNKGKTMKVDNLTYLYTVKNAIQKYYSNLCAVNAVEYYSDYSANKDSNIAIQIVDESNRNKEYFSNLVYQCLAPEYISKAGITKENIGNLDNADFQNPLVEIYSAYYISEFENIYVYLVNGIVRDTATYKGREFNLIVNIDMYNYIFEIYPDDYLENQDFSNMKEGDELEINIPKSIENRQFNTLSTTSIKYPQAIQNYFQNVRRIMLYDHEKAYELLDDEQKSKYSTYESYDSYLNENEKEIFKLTYGSYKLRSLDGVSVFEIYNSDSTKRLTITMDGFSSFKYKLEDL